jgi:hypothetical protein
MNGDINENDQKTLNELIEIDPVSVAIFWDRIYQTYHNNVIKNKDGPFGKVDNDFWRREYQLRG